MSRCCPQSCAPKLWIIREGFGTEERVVAEGELTLLTGIVPSRVWPRAFYKSQLDRRPHSPRTCPRGVV